MYGFSYEINTFWLNSTIFWVQSDYLPSISNFPKAARSGGLFIGNEYWYAINTVSPNHTDRAIDAVNARDRTTASESTWPAIDIGGRKAT
jgi:hypothetical protein